MAANMALLLQKAFKGTWL